MPFEVFRRHQRKLLAVFAILAMFGFVVADSLPRYLNSGGPANGNPVVVELYGKPVRRSDIVEMQEQRKNANYFMAELTASSFGRPYPQFFGELNTRSVVDALVLQHEADRLGMPVGGDLGREFIKQFPGPPMTAEKFDLILARFNNRVSGDQLLTDISNQVRLLKVSSLRGVPVVTPHDVYQAYRDQNERVSARAVGFRVEDFLSKVSEPGVSELQAYYDRYHDVLPDPLSPTPGFKIPRQIQVEVLSADGEAIARAFKDKLTDTELRAYYENRKSDFKKPSEFPDQIFEGDEKLELTPPLVQPFDDVRPYLSTSLAEDKAQTDVLERFGRVKDDHMIKFVETYLDASDAREDAEKSGGGTAPPLPKPESLKPVGDSERLTHEITPLMTRPEAETHGILGVAEVGTSRMSGGKKFADEMFDSKATLYEPVEFTDFSGHRFLVRKLQDNPPRVPSLEEIRPKVVLAWKTEKARPVAEKAARDFASAVEKDGGKIKGEIVEGRPVITTEPVTRLRTGAMLPGRFLESGPAVPSEIPQIANAGDALREAYFGLTDTSVAVAPDRPESTYYVLTMNRRVPASFASLFQLNGEFIRYRSEVLSEARVRFAQDWLDELRAEAGLKKNWVPEDETQKG